MGDGLDELPVGTRIRVAGTVDREVAEKLNKILADEKQRAKLEDRPLPDGSAILEMLLRKGIRAYEKENS